MFWPTFVKVQGTWILEGEDQGIPLQRSEITCVREWNHCVQATASLEFYGSDSTGVMSVETTLQEIQRWDEFEIVTAPDDKACVRYTMRISRRQKSVTGLRTTLTTKDLCKGVEDRDIRLKLVDGFEVWKKLDEKRDVQRRRLLQVDWSAVDKYKRQEEARNKRPDKPSGEN
jgi:hypothetical protein